MNRRSGYESKKRIVEAAIKIFSQHGYNGTTIRMIAKEAGISVGGVYLYFKNKEELFLFLMKEKMEELDHRITPIIQDTEHPASALREYIRIAIECALENRELIMLHSKELGLAFGMDMKKEFFEKQRTLLKSLVEKCIKAGEFIECNSEQVARLIMHIIRGYVHSIVIDPENLID
ncbi:MAG: TetR/AcrR family transcriptional regulator, partial [Thermodesulfovibrio sp.]|nr:TetR/AcrR family transcriptional regulator [Thermodesulfovibrio sp.]